MILRNHGTLTLGRTIGEAFAFSYRLERACRMQITTQSDGARLREIAQSAIDKGVRHGKRYMSKEGISPGGQREWAAVVRQLERIDPATRNFR